MTEDFIQRLPDSLDNSKDQIYSDDEEKLNMFMNCDMNINMLFESTKTSKSLTALNSKKAQQYT